MQSLVALIALAAYASAQSGANGVATFNNYAAQGNTVCGPKSATIGGAYGAALGDLSPLWYGQKCAGDSSNMSECTLVKEGKYQGPYCPKTFCNNKCFSACNEGPIGGEGKGISANGKCIKVQIIDVCPSESADNYCKTSVPANERCGAPGVNALDIDISAYQALTGQAYNSDMPNLNINVTPVAC